MSNIKAAAVQIKCTKSVDENLKTAERAIREAAKNGANIILLPELFEREYFCQERRYEYYEYATPVNENPAVLLIKQLAKELGVVIPVSFYEKDGLRLFNSVAMVDSGGEILGVYRKTHIPDDHYYQEKFYFTPGDTGFKVWDTRFGRVGVGICWDQWFPEAARAMAIMGADILLYPTAIGSEPILGCDSSMHWRRTMQGHAAANIIPVVAANRYGLETVEPCAENGGQKSELEFYGTSFICDETGDIKASAGRAEDKILYADFNFEEIRKMRLEWGLFRDRRPEMYKIISSR